jgi:hypothetical protein
MLPHLSNATELDHSIGGWLRQPGVEQYVSVSARVHHFAAFLYLSRVVTPGYRVKDTWECPESGINVRWHIRHRIKAYFGFLLERG